MNRMNFVVVIILIIYLTACGEDSSPSYANQPTVISYGTDKLFEPSNWRGSYNVGSMVYHWIDDYREEPHTTDPNDKRELMVRVFYPTNAEYSDNRLPILNEAYWNSLKDHERVYKSKLRYSNYKDVKWNIELDASVSDTSSDYPVLIFSHGYGLFPESHVAITGELASRGYIVVSISHPYGAGLTTYPDGREAGYVPLPSDNLGADLELWSDDQLFVIDQLELINQEPNNTLFSRLDLTRIGTLGHSYGGAAAYYSASKDLRVTAAIDMDGGIFNSEDKFMSQPFLYMQNETGKNLEIFTQVDNDGYAVIFDHNITHMSFADLSLFWRWDFPEQHPLGPLDSEVAINLITDITDQFFKKYFYTLPAPFLDDGEQKPDVIRVLKYQPN